MILCIPHPLPDLEAIRAVAKPLDDAYALHNHGGAYNPPGGLELAHVMLKAVEQHVGLPLQVANTFAWDWQPNSGGELLPHTDREGLDWTISLPLDEASTEWPLHAEGSEPFTPALGEGVLLNGRKVSHWREPGPPHRSTWLLLHYTEAPVATCVFTDLFSKYEIGRILSGPHEWQPGTTYTGTNRQAQVSWLFRTEEWEWLYHILDAWMMPLLPPHTVLADPQPDSIQVSRYVPSDYFGWHADYGNENTRVLSATVLLQAADEGGNFELRDEPLEPLQVGDMVIFRSYLQHQVTPVLRGERYSLTRWLSEAK